MKAALRSFQRREIIDALGPMLKDLLPELEAAAYVAVGLTKPGISLGVFDDLKRVVGTLDPAQRVIYEASRRRAFQLVSEKATQTEERLREEINKLLIEGATTQTGTQRLTEVFDALGLVPKNSYAIENLFRTQTQLAYGAARWQADQDPDIQEILWGYEYVTVGDDRVRPSHEALDGMILPKDDPRWNYLWPPNGYSCRCQVIPVFEEVAVVQPPDDARADIDFDFNPGKFLNELAASMV